MPSAVAADTPDPVADAKAFRNYFVTKFPNVPLDDFANGPYSLNEDMRRQWEEKEQFPPYEFSLEMGKEMFAKPFKNGKSYGDCFPNQGIGIRQNYPYFDPGEGKVITLELALNRCRGANGEPPLSYVEDEMAALTAYMAFTSRGKPFDIKIPDDPRALEAYQNGKRYFYTRRGQLNFSCATCHVYIDENSMAKLPKKQSDEQELLTELSDYRAEASRLSCQVDFTEALSGIKVTIAPDS